MPRGRQKASKGFRPGAIYDLFFRKKTEESEKSEIEQVREKLKGFEEFCRKAHASEKYSGPVPKEVKDSVDFLELDIPPEAVVSGAKYAAKMAALAGIVLSLALLQTLGYVDFTALSVDVLYSLLDLITTDITLWFILALPFILYAGAYYSVLSYPSSMAQQVFNKDLLPSLRVIGNMILSMKLVPNLEKAMRFAVEHGRGFLSEELKKVLWDTSLGVYATVEEGLDRIAYRVGRYSDEFKHALMRIRTSLLEGDDAKRYVLLDGALSEAVDGVRSRMVAMASSLYMPSIQIFYLGIFLPLLLFIIIPVWAAFSENTPFSNPIVLIGLYDVLLPALTFYMAKSVISRRPQAYVPPEIPGKMVKDYRRKKNAWIGQAVALLIIGLAAVYYLHTLMDNTPGKVLATAGVCDIASAESCAEELRKTNPDLYEYYMSGEDTTPYVLIFGSFIVISAALSFYLYNSTREKIQIQKEVMETEKEFKDAVYVLASRMGEGKPLESALDAVSENMPESKIAALFQRISYNVKNLGLTLEDAVFSPVFGVLKDYPSKLLHDAMRLVVSAVKLGTELAAKALAALSEQLRNEETVVERIREKTGEIATMMLTMAYLVGPVVLGITVGLEKVIVSSVASMETPEIDTSELGEIGMITSGALGVFQSKGKGTQIPDWAFILAVALYNVEVSALLTWFASYLHDGPNKVSLLRKLSYTVFIATLLFSLSAYMSVTLVKGMM